MRRKNNNNLRVYIDGTDTGDHKIPSEIIGKFQLYQTIGLLSLEIHVL